MFIQPFHLLLAAMTSWVPRVLRHLQTIRLGRLQLGPDRSHSVMTEVPKNLNQQLLKLGLAPLFASPPQSKLLSPDPIENTSISLAFSLDEIGSSVSSLGNVIGNV